MTRRLGTLLIPILLLAAMIGLFHRHAALLAALRQSWSTNSLPYAVLGAAAILAWRFNRSMLAFLCLYLIALHLGLTRLYWRGSYAEHFRQATTLATPLFFLWFFGGRERGVVSEHGLMRFLFMLFALVLLAVMVQFMPGLPERLLPAWALRPLWPGTVPVPRLAVLLFAATWLFMAMPSAQRDPQHGPLLGAVLLAVFAAFIVVDPQFSAWRTLPADGNRLLAGLSAASLALSAAGLLTLYTVLEISHGTAFTDQLTQLPGRRALDYRLSALGSNYAIAMVDIDHFKKINDKYGHDVGDQALRFIAAKLRQVPGGRAYRYGGEEFAIVFPGCAVDQVEPTLNALREGIRNAAFHLRQADRAPSKIKGTRRRGKQSDNRARVPITVSIGVADSSAGDIDGPEDVIVDADKALYKAKKAGRNCVVASRRRRLDVRRVLVKE